LIGLAACAGCGTQIGIIASPSEIYVDVGGAAAVNVLALFDIAAPVPVTEPLTITSNDDAIATVTDQTVTGVTEGIAVLSITDGTFTTTANVYVVPAGTLPTQLVVTPTSIACTPTSGDTQLEVYAILTTGIGEDVTDRASYSSSDSTIALVTADGVVVCVGQGEATVVAQYLGVSDAVEVSVGAAPPSTVGFSPSSLTCKVGESRPVQVLASSADGSTTDVSLSAAYSSSDMAVAIAAAGQIECLSEGSATITAEVSGTAGTMSVDVEPAAGDPDELVDLRITPSPIECGLGSVGEFGVVAEYGDGRTTDVTANRQTQYGSSDGSVALVFPGQVYCVQAGQATIQAAFGGLTTTATVDIR
jgi:hypothetical protein